MNEKKRRERGREIVKKEATRPPLKRNASVAHRGSDFWLHSEKQCQRRKSDSAKSKTTVQLSTNELRAGPRTPVHFNLGLAQNLRPFANILSPLGPMLESIFSSVLKTCFQIFLKKLIKN